MNKTILITAILICLPAVGKAQTVINYASAQHYRGFSVRPFVGLNISDIGGDDGPAYYTQATGLACGADVEYRWSRLFGVSTGLHYSVLGCKTNETNYKTLGYKDQMAYSENYHYDRYAQRYFSVPLMVNIHAWKGLKIGLGMQLSKLLAARLQGKLTGYRNKDFESPAGATVISDWIGTNAFFLGLPAPQATSENMSKPVRVDESLNIGIRNAFNRFETSIPISISYEYRNIEMEVTYIHGLSELYDDNYEGHKLLNHYHLNVNNRSLCITLGYRFH